jgi:PAS domain S-box-containing protein
LRVAGTVGSALLFGFLIVSAATIFRGLNRRDELLAQAHASEEKLAITLASIADGVIATDAFGSVNFLNPVAEQLTGWSLLDCAGRHIAEIFRIVNETTRETAANALERAISDGHAVGLANHTKLIAKDGREIHIDDSAAPIRDKNNRIIGAVLVFRDISERRQSEHNLAETTLALQRSNEDLEQFAFAASHDLRSPLRNVTTMALMIARRFGESLGNDGSAMVGHIADSADRMSRLVEDLLTLAKVTSPNREPPRPVSVQTALHAACESLRDEIQATAAIITADPLPVVGAVDSHVALLLQNMLSNAIKYRGPASPLIHVSALQESSEWIVSVKDNGIGIDPQYAEQIFQPFKRLHGSEYEGTGIGLWTCRKIVSACGGRIWVESEEGKGSTFFFSLPAPKLTG